MRTKHLYSLKVAPHRRIINFKRKNVNIALGKTGRYHFKQVPTELGANWHHEPPDVKHYEEHNIKAGITPAAPMEKRDQRHPKSPYSLGTSRSWKAKRGRRGPPLSFLPGSGSGCHQLLLFKEEPLTAEAAVEKMW